MAVGVERERVEVRDALPVLEYAPAAEPSTPRVIGFDIARALAILAMMVDHCAQALGPAQPIGWGGALLGMIDGRASAIFVVLAGVGVTLLNRRQTPAEIRAVLIRRGAFLLAIGFINQAIWPGDILRLFGVTMMAAGFFVGFSSRKLLATAIAVICAFPVLMLVSDYNARWDWDSYTYRGLWTPAGALRNLFYDGFRPVIPWAGLLILGMWIGRLDTTRASVRRRMLLWGVGLTAGAETVSHYALAYWLKHPHGFSEDTIRAICETGSMPPLPIFVMTVIGTALTFIALALMVGHRWSENKLHPLHVALGDWLMRPLMATGQMALTWYIFHIAVGAVWVSRRGWHSAGTVTNGILFGAVFFCVLVVISAVWKRHFKYGPMEWVLRNVSN
jgi:uncharacterized membrane protein YeiB